ncbi:hypothetical protein [Maritimibacter dapengensis]|uniref:Uncharacterized protein n=1 Tax=Maritimibacter dapengensis TaxID=2836868 RepID=A0ABS6SXZ8_9RHOB|nr:hypothetical protein [Maritimibacter dapengensis]MBV7377388.1 hypothetical protein [Maritimibacter dapengensis]
MAATTPKNQKDVNVLRPSRASADTRRIKSRKRLPTLTSDEIEEFFKSADARNKNWRLAA